jgi:NitT/TauT family transport system substrate-binding protein
MKIIYHKNVILILMVFIILSACIPAHSTTQPNSISSPVQITVAKQPIHIKLGIIPYASYLPFYIAQEEGFFKEHGLDVEIVQFSKQSDAIPVLVNGQIDVYSGQLDTMTLNAISQGATIKIVADKGFENPAGCVYTAWVAREDLLASGALNDIHHLAGLKIGYPRGQAPEYALDLLLSQVGLSSADVQIVDVSAPNRVAALENGAIDIAFLSEPYITEATSSGKAGVWKSWESYMPDFQLGILMYGGLLLENPFAGQSFMVAYLEAVRQYMLGKTAGNVELMAAFLKTTTDVARQSCWQSMRSDGNVNVQSILDFQHWAVDKGYQLKTLLTSEFWDPSFISYADNFLK